MNDRDQNANKEKNHKFLVPLPRKKIRTYAKKLSIIAALELLTLTSYASDINTVREIQLMLSLKGYDLSYGDSRGIDGKLGSVTREAIINYQKKKTLPLTGAVNKRLYDSLYEDTKSKLPLSSDGVEEKKDKDPKEQKQDDSKIINTLSGELNTAKDDLKDTKAVLNTLRDNMAYYFITNFSYLVSILAAIIGIVIAVAVWFVSWRMPKYEAAVEDRIKKSIKGVAEETEAEMAFRIYTNMSRACYLEYRVLLGNIGKNISHFKNIVERAIWFSDGAIDKANKLPEGEDKSNKVIFAESHRAFHYASLGHAKNLIDNDKRTAALSLVPKIKSSGDDFLQNQRIDLGIDCIDTAAWILILLGDDSQKTLGRNMLKDLSKRRDIPPIYLDEIKLNYNLINENGIF